MARASTRGVCHTGRCLDCLSHSTLGIFIHARTTSGTLVHWPVCKCKLRLPGGATPSPDRLTRPAELRLGVINVFAKRNQKPPTAGLVRARPRLCVAIVEMRFVKFIKKRKELVFLLSAAGTRAFRGGRALSYLSRYTRSFILLPRKRWRNVMESLYRIVSFAILNLMARW